MTALEIVKNAYPGIPIAILMQYQNLLPAEASALDFSFSLTDKSYYLNYIDEISAKSNLKLQFTWTADFNNLNQSFEILRPTNTIYKNTIFDSQPWSVEVIFGKTWKTENRNITTVFDNRIFNRPEYRVENQQVSYFRALGMPGYALARNDITVNMKLPMKKYTGIESVNAAMQNGIAFDADPLAVEQFTIYLNAYKKYSTQIDAEKRLLEQQAQITIDNYAQELNNQASIEYADLQAKKIQLLIAIDNDAKSAQRDFQNMLLTAQGLKNQIGGNLV